MAMFKNLIEKVNDLTECPICTETLRDPVVLPCIHTFCLECLQQHGRGKLPGDKVPCSVCRSKFKIPPGGVRSLPRNFFIQKLLDGNETANDLGETNCDACSRGGATAQPKTAVVSCVECHQTMCEECADSHKLLMAMKDHQLTPTNVCTRKGKLMQCFVNLCATHPDEETRIYCLQCRELGCLVCFLHKHKFHDCCGLEEAVDRIKLNIHEEMNEVDEQMTGIEKRFLYIDTQAKKIVERYHMIKLKIEERREELKQLIDNHCQQLLDDLNVQNENQLREVENKIEELESRRISLESLKSYSQEVINRSILSELTRFEINLKAGTTVLDGTNQSTNETREFRDLAFIPADLSAFLMNRGRNIIGEMLDKTEDAKDKLTESVSLDDSATPEPNVDLSKSDHGDDCLFPMAQPAPTRKNQSIFLDEDDDDLFAPINFHPISTSRVSTVSNRKSTNSKSEPTTASRGPVASSSDALAPAPVASHSSQGSMTLKLAKTQTHEGCVLGLAKLGKEVFVLFHNSNELLVYNNTLLVKGPSIHVHGLQEPQDMVASICSTALFIGDSVGQIHRIKIPGKLIMTWSTGEDSLLWSLSLTPCGNVLAGCGRNNIKEFKPTGDLVRTVSLPSNIASALHVLQMTDGGFLVCQDLPEHRICLLNNAGDLLKSYDHVHSPTYMAVDRKGNIFVLDGDFFDSRVMLFNSRLELVSESIQTCVELKEADRLLLDEKHNALYISDATDKKLLVFCCEQSMT